MNTLRKIESIYRTNPASTRPPWTLEPKATDGTNISMLTTETTIERAATLIASAAR